MLERPTMARVLVVEDEQDLQDVMDYNLRAAGHDVSLSAGGAPVMSLVQQSPPDLILLDLMLPDMSGLEVCRNLKSHPLSRGIPIIMVTARGAEVDRIVGFELGADDYVVKPFSVRELMLRVQAILRRKRAEAPAPAGPV